METLREVLSATFFMPHGHCYLWNPVMVWLQVGSNGLIALAYLAISSMLVYLVYRVKGIPFRWMFVAFGVFIVACGLTHLSDIVVVWNPIYWVDGTLRALTATVSVATAILLPPLIPKAMELVRAFKAAQEHGVKLETMVKDLGSMYEKSRELDALKTQFFANISHELRTPLALIMGPAEKLIANERLTSAERKDATLILKNAGTLLKHVNDLLDVSKLEAGKMGLEYVEVDVRSTVKLVTANFEGIAMDRNIRFTEEIIEGIMGQIDPDKFQRIILNLLSNAFKFTPAGGAIYLGVKKEKRISPFEEHANQEIDWVTLMVGDSGPGIPQEQRQAIFERFRQLDGGTRRKFGGTGLGLSIVKSFVDLHFGTISVGDAPKGGALFTLSLPLVAPPSARIHMSSPKETPEMEEVARQAIEELRARVEALSPADAKEKPLLLVVEDHPDMNRFIQESLSDEYRVAAAMNGKEALQIINKEKPDLLVSDVMMPEMSGDELVGEIRKKPELDLVPILLLTAKADDELRIKLLKEGAQDYIMKPFSVSELRARVSNWITVKRVHDILQAETEQQTRDLETLAREVTSKKRDLQGALDSMRVLRDQAIRVSKLKSNFLSMISHELRSPLTAMQLQLQILKRDPKATVSDKQRDIVQRIERSTARMTELIDSLLQYVRVESGKLTTEIEPTDISALAESLIGDFRPEAEAKGLALKLNKEGDVPVLATDPRLLQLILTNLLANALKFTDKGGIEITLSKANGSCRIVVADTGPGISPSDQERIFEPFEQVGSTREKNMPGVGLGLAIVRQILTALGGKVELESQVDLGSRFVVSLPYQYFTRESKSNGTEVNHV